MANTLKKSDPLSLFFFHIGTFSHSIKSTKKKNIITVITLLKRKTRAFIHRSEEKFYRQLGNKKESKLCKWGCPQERKEGLREVEATRGTLREAVDFRPSYNIVPHSPPTSIRASLFLLLTSLSSPPPLTTLDIKNFNILAPGVENT